MTRTPPRLIAAVLLTIVALSLIVGRFTAADDKKDQPPEAQSGEYKITGPIVHDNLAIFFIHGSDQPGVRHYLTLQEALDRKVITIYETGNVNQLAIENTSDSIEVYIQSGDIVKGGRQDRTIAMDFLCPPKSNLPIDTFCVEHGRWSQRGGESASNFGSSTAQLSGNALKVAAKGANSQSEVWRQVEVLQNNATANAGVSVNAAQSASSLQLSLENTKLQEMTEAYVKEMATLTDVPDVIGYAFAINGKMRSADVYASHELFAKLWPKMLKATAVEAVAYLQKGKTFDPPAMVAAKNGMHDAEGGKVAERMVTDRVQMITRESQGDLLYETRDRAAGGGGWIHRNYLTKDEETKAALRSGQGRGQLELQQGIEPLRNNFAPMNAPASQPVGRGVR